MNPQSTPPTQSSESQIQEMRAKSKRLKRRILVIFACMLSFVVIAGPLISYMDSRENQPDRDVATRRPTSISFCTPQYGYDIMQDQEYLAKNRYLFYEDMSSGVTIMLDEQSVSSYGSALVTLTEMIQCIIQGDHEGYNALFSKEYFADPKHQPEDPFTMQRLYDIKLSRRSATQVRPEGGGAYMQYEFFVEYKIQKNDGTFRTDIGHDESRRQLFVLTERGSGKALIDNIVEIKGW